MDKDDPVLYEIIKLNQKEIIEHTDIKNLEKTYLEERVKLFRDEHKLNILSDKYSALKSLSKKIISRYASLIDTSLQLSDINKKILTLQEINEKIKNLSIRAEEKEADIAREVNKTTITLPPINTEPVNDFQSDNEKDKKIEELEKIIKDLKQENIALQIENKNRKLDKKVKFEGDKLESIEEENQEEIYTNNIMDKYKPKISFEIKLGPVYDNYGEEEYKSEEKKYETIDSEQYDENTNESYDADEDREHNYKIDESLEDEGDKRFCEHLLYLYEEIQFITYDKTITPDKKYLQIMDMYNAYKKYLSYYVNKERLDYIDKMIDELNIPNLEEKNIFHFYDEINNLIFDPFLIIE